ncbi:Serine protease, subtilisin family [Sinosporangium album]|uniref:Serine protease, subtilisin family n=1 Tax=Sinosporangium album TaxID=504805 RepID=A0A1G8DUU6_9ACTN|nr:S8 family serine peptidase [Sinosporangium album]SDH61385.1 Serine protease, subtilisin family [Sinosporangium album]
MRVMIQLRPSSDVVAAVADPDLTATAADVADRLPGVVLDDTYTPVAVPHPIPAPGGDPLSLRQPLTYSLAREDASVMVRGEIADDELSTRLNLLPLLRRDVVGVYADPVIETSLVCGGDPAVGDWHDVARLMRVEELHAAGLDGSGTALAVLDSGVNAAHVARQLGRDVTLDTTRSWSPSTVEGAPGEFDVDHGTMCAFDALITAPRASVIDIPLLLSRARGGTAIGGVLSDAVAAFSHLRGVLDAQPVETRALVVTNSWGSFSPRWDFPAGHPGNYSDNPSHPFNLIVASLEQAGADILFAAGNCGGDCADSRCGFADRPIVGANSHPLVLSVGGVDVRARRVGYSSQGPGRLSNRKPDLCAYTHFSGSQAYAPAPDSGTSAACPVAAGLVAAIRTRWPAARLSPAELRTVLRRTADHPSGAGFDHDLGYGIVDPAGVLAALRRRAGA